MKCVEAKFKSVPATMIASGTIVPKAPVVIKVSPQFSNAQSPLNIGKPVSSWARDPEQSWVFSFSDQGGALRRDPRRSGGTAVLPIQDKIPPTMPPGCHRGQL